MLTPWFLGFVDAEVRSVHVLQTDGMLSLNLITKEPSNQISNDLV